MRSDRLFCSNNIENLVKNEESGKEIPESSGLEFSEDL